ncbi:MAG: hypothetical protein ACT4QG_17335 [Sporichthyaceae bacterium]
MQITKKKIAAVVATTAVIALGASGAYAYWTTTGTGTGSATTTTSAAVNAVQDTPAPSLLAPSVSKPISFHLNNTATFPQQVSAVVITVANASGPAWSAQADTSKPACTAADFVITQPAQINANIPAGDQTGTVYSASIQMTNRADTVPGDGSGNQDNCKNVTVPLQYAVS